MLVVETIAKIRRYHFVEGRKIKQIARDLFTFTRKPLRAESRINNGLSEGSIFLKIPSVIVFIFSSSGRCTVEETTRFRGI